MANKKQGVVICGAYGMENAGDDAVLAAMVAALRRLDENMPITVLARRPSLVARRFGVAAIHPLRPVRWLIAMRRAALFLSGGGSLLQDVTSRRSLWYYLAAIRAAKKRGCAVQLYGCGIGPLLREESKRKTAEILNACVDAITVRDEQSAETLRAVGVTKPRVMLAADPALSLDSASGERERCFGLALRPWPGLSAHTADIAAAVRYVYETYRLAPVFFCLGPGDRSAAEPVIAALDGVPHTVSANTKRLGRSTLVLSMRLHGLVFSLRDGAPAAGLSYDPKVSAFCGEAGYPCLPLEELTAEGLCRLMDEAAHLDAESLRAAAASLRERERANARVAAELLA